VQRKLSHSVLVLLSALLFAGAGCAESLAAGSSGTFVAANCAPVAAASSGTMVWASRNGAGVWEPYVGNGNCEGSPLLAPYAGNRGPADITANGRYVLLTTAEGVDKTLRDSSPGQGSGNSIQLYDRQTGKLSTLLPGATASQRGLIWPTFNANATKIVWSQMVKPAAEAPPDGQWALHVANVNLEAGTLSHNVEWQDPNGDAAFYETYGWVPGTNRLIFMSNTRASVSGFAASQLFTLPEELNPSTAPTRISPPIAPSWPWQSATSAFHEFAHFAPNEPNTLYTAIGTDTVGGDDLFSYNMKSQEAGGLLGQPTRISYFGGDLNANWGTKAVPGWPAPAYTVVTSMAWVNGQWIAAICPDMLCSQVSAWRISLATSEPPLAIPLDAEGGAAPVVPAPAPTGPPSKSAKTTKQKKRSCTTAAAAKAHAAKKAHGAARGRVSRRTRAAVQCAAKAVGAHARHGRAVRHAARKGGHRAATS
jgi:hypothetical protein